MALRATKAHYKLGEILPRHWHALVHKSGLPGLWPQMQALVHHVPDAIAQVAQELPADFPQALAQAIFAGMQQHAQRFNTQLALNPTRVL